MSVPLQCPFSFKKRTACKRRPHERRHNRSNALHIQSLVTRWQVERPAPKASDSRTKGQQTRTRRAWINGVYRLPCRGIAVHGVTEFQQQPMGHHESQTRHFKGRSNWSIGIIPYKRIHFGFSCQVECEQVPRSVSALTSHRLLVNELQG